MPLTYSTLLTVFANNVRLISLVCGLLLTGCSSNPLKTADLAALPPSAEILNLAWYPQQDNFCGPSSLATMLDFNHIKVTPQQLTPKLYIPEKGGTLQLELIAQARQFGLVPYQIKPKLTDLLTELSAGHPVLVMQNLGFSWLPQWHFAVAIGYDLDQQNLILRSGPSQRYETDLGLFMKTWNRANNWALVILTPDKLPATATATRYMQTASNLEQLELLNHAETAYRTAHQRWPDSASSLMGLGNIHYAQQRYPQAINYFLNYISQSDNPAPGWNNLAYSLAQYGCEDAALRAIHCAVTLDPGHPLYSDSLTELSSQFSARTKAFKGAANCPIITCP